MLGRMMLSTCSPGSLQIQDGAGAAGGHPTETLVSALRQGLAPMAKCSGPVHRERGGCWHRGSLPSLHFVILNNLGGKGKE